MKVTKRNVPFYYERNKGFNEEVKGLAENIFQHQKVGRIGYVPARTSTGIPTPVSGSDSDIFPDSREAGGHLDRFDLSGLGEYEKRIFATLILGRYRTYVLTGDMGSGKTATIDCLVEALTRPRSRTCGELCHECSPIVIKLDFNAGFPDDKLDVLLKQFREQLYTLLRQELRELFRTTTLSDELLRVIVDSLGSRSNYAVFDRFAQEHEDIIEWNEKTRAEKANLIFSYVDECTKNGTENLAVMMRLVRLTKEKLRSDRACLILLFDNIDSMMPEVQDRMFAEILAYQDVANAQALVTMRRTTFGKFTQNRAAYSFGTIDHKGPDIKEILTRRLEYYVQNWDSLPEVGIGDPIYKQAAKARLDYLVRTKDDSRDAVQRVAPICGASIRLGLFMCERFLVNSVVPFNESPRYKDEVFRAVLVGNEKTGEISPDDRCIVNLLLNKATGEASLLNIRILQLIAEFEIDKPYRTIGNLASMLNTIGGWSKDEVRIALNYLLQMKRPLLWADGKIEYDRLTMARHSDDMLHLTEAGYSYLRELVLDLVYIQEAALSLKWNGGNIPSTVDYSKLVERFQVLRCFLYELAVQDLRETENFKAWLETKGTRFSVRPILFINRIIASVGKSALNILLHRLNELGKLDADVQAKHETLEELKYWRAIINEWLAREKTISGAQNKKLEQLSNEYRQRVR